jgi:response regulator RpfG family c-di-GMP phosphodiesterase
MEQISEQILLVDDDPETMKLHSLLLRKAGFKVQSFLNSQEALSFLKFTQKNISLIISDISMPNFNGIEFLKKVKNIKDYHSLPFIYISAVDKKETILKAYENGALCYILKPVDADILRAQVISLVAHFRILSFKNRILLEGSHKKYSIEEILAWCETEKLHGFVSIRYAGDEALIKYKKGNLEQISFKNLTGAEAFEAFRSWSRFQFCIVSGEYNKEVLQDYLNNQQN